MADKWPGGSVLRDLRRDRFGENKRAAAHAIGVSDTAWARWEKGESRPTPSNLHALCELFDVEAATFYQGDVFRRGRDYAIEQIRQKLDELETDLEKENAR